METLNFNGVNLTPESISAAQQWFADNAQGCIDEVLSGEVKVNNPESYIKSCEESKKRFLDGEHLVSFTFLQTAYFIQTGESVALLP